MVPYDRDLIGRKTWPQPTLTFHFGFSECFEGDLLIPNTVVSVEEVGIGKHIFPGGIVTS